MQVASQRLGEYILLETIGAGTFGVVWRAQHHAWASKIVAIKVPTDPQYVRDLQREGIAVQKLAHPSIVKPLNFDPYGDPPYLVMEYVDGESLRALLKRGRLKVEHAIAVMRQVLYALEHAHKHGIIHRDIKPENILIDKAVETRGFASGIVKLTDFGLGKTAAQFEGSIVLSQEQSAQIVGSQQYMAPEQLAGETVDARADLYSCGIVLFEMLTGHRPTGTEVPSDLNAAVPKHLDEAYRSAVARREKRIASAGDFLTAISAARRAGTPQVTGQKLSPVTDVANEVPAASGAEASFLQKYIAYILMVLTVLACVAALVILFSSDGSPKSPPAPPPSANAGPGHADPVHRPVADPSAPVIPVADVRVDPRWRLLVYNKVGTLRVFRNGALVGQVGEQMAMFLSPATFADGDLIVMKVDCGGDGYVRVAGLTVDRRSYFQPMDADLKDVVGVPIEDLKAADLTGVAKSARSIGSGKPIDRIAWNKLALDAPLYDSQFVTGGDAKTFTLAFVFHPSLVGSTAIPRHPLQEPPLPIDCGQGEWTGKLLVYTRQGHLQALVNNRPLFDLTGPAASYSPEFTVRAGDLLSFRGQGEVGVIRAAFLTRDGTACLPLTAANLRDVTGTPAGTLTMQGILAAVGHNGDNVYKVPLSEIQQWEQVGGPFTPRGAQFVSVQYPACFELACPVQASLFRAAQPHLPIETRSGMETLTFKFDDEQETAKDWKWKAGFKMTPDGAIDGRESDNNLESRFTLDGDFAVDLDAAFGGATYTNTGGINITVCGREIGFDGGWNFGDWGDFDTRVRVQRLGDELLLIRNGFALVETVGESQRNKPTHWRLWWRTRSSHIREIKVQAEKIGM